MYYYHCHLANEPAYRLSEKKPQTTAHNSVYGSSYTATGLNANDVQKEHHLRFPTDTQSQTHTQAHAHTHSSMNQHTLSPPTPEAAHIPHTQPSEYSVFGASHHPPTPHPQIAGYSGAFRTSHPPTLGYGAPPAVRAGASPIQEEMGREIDREGAVSPPLPPRSPSRLEKGEYGFVGARAGADTMRP